MRQILIKVKSEDISDYEALLLAANVVLRHEGNLGRIDSSENVLGVGVSVRQSSHTKYPTFHVKKE